ncbi:MAG: RNA polymerase sigma factor (sigma-70 family) [Pseudohongiellaceae bacterium]|jgi:RNA polymerase sigma factor (sigma-70 family)
MDPLIQRAKEGCNAARGELQLAFADDLKGYMRRHVGLGLGRKISHADLCQETFVRVFKGLHSLPDEGTLGIFRARLLRTAEWVIRDAARSMKRLAGESMAGELGPELVLDPADKKSMGDVTRDDQSRWLHRLLKQLPRPYGDVIRQKLAGDDFRTIADRLGEQEATVRKRYERACRRLRQLVEMSSQGEAG